MLSLIHAVFASLNIGEPTRGAGLATFPLFPSQPAPCAFRLLPDAITEGAEVRENDELEGEWYRNLRVSNQAPFRILVRDADLLVGGAQNRVPDQSVLIAPGGETEVPVSCVEEGRATQLSETFHTATASVEAGLRADRARTAVGPAERPDQSRTWRRVAERRHEAGLDDGSGSLHEVEATREDALAEAVANHPPVYGATGLAIVMETHEGARVHSIEYYADPDACRSAWSGLVRAAALEVPSGLGAPGGAGPEVHRQPHEKFDVTGVRRFMSELENVSVEPLPLVGEGAVTRLMRHDVVGQCVSLENQVVYLSMLTHEEPATLRQLLPVVAVADLHGHLSLFDRLLEVFDERYGEDYILVLLGDYVDNGPEIPELLERLCALKRERGSRFVAIMGNHDLACLRAMGWDGGAPDEGWFQRWQQRFWNPGGSTAAAYGASSGAELAEKMPAQHRDFLQSLPWCVVHGEYVFVHAGMKEGPLQPQLDELARRSHLPQHYWTHDQLRDKALATVHDPSWDHVVVSAHTKNLPGPSSPLFLAERRITLDASVDRGGYLWAIRLPAGELVRVDRHGAIACGYEPASMTETESAE